MIRLGYVDGNPYVGVYCAASESLAIVPNSAQPKEAKEIGRILGVQVIVTNLAGATIVGVLVAMNSNGIIVSNFAEKNELARVPQDVRVAKMEEKINAAGNNLLVNDNAALVHPDASSRTLRFLEDVLGVEVQRGRVAGIDTVGSACIATAKGIVCHPRTSDDQLKWLSEYFRVPSSVATLNYGTPYLGACA